MTRPLRIALYALALLLMVPALMMVVDAWSWLVIGHTMTGREWFGQARNSGSRLRRARRDRTLCCGDRGGHDGARLMMSLMEKVRDDQ